MNHQLKLCNCVLPIAASAICLLAAQPSEAALQNRYTFNDGTVQDSFGGAHGTLVDPSGTAFYSGGQVRLTNNNGAGSNQDFTLPTTVGAYVDLPNGLINQAANEGNFFEFSLEFWATVQENRDWARLGDFGTSNDGENTSGGADSSDYLIVVPRTGGRPTPEETNKFSASSHSQTGQEDFVPAATDLATGVEHHIVVTINQFEDFDPGTVGVGDNGTMRLYLNGAEIAAGPVEDEGNIDFTFINDNNNWLGRAQWPDPLFDGSYNEFSIYNHALLPGEVASNFAAGPIEAPPFPTLIVDRTTGVITIANGTTDDIDLLSYEITSASGSLDPVSWTSVSAGGFDSDGVWSATSSTENAIAEGTTGDGGQLAALSGESISQAWNPSPFEDLQFAFELADGTMLNGDVNYIGLDGPIAAADLDGDGNIDEDDFTLFQAAAHTDLAGGSAYDQYKAGDLNNDGFNNYADFRLMKDAFIAARGQAAFTAFITGAPEPASVMLLVLAALPLAVRIR